MSRKSIALRLAIDDWIVNALRGIDATLGDEPPGKQAMAIIRYLKELRDGNQIRNPEPHRVDYLEQAQNRAREDFGMRRDGSGTGHVDTPLGRLSCETWRKTWTGTRGTREVWESEYYLNADPITVAEIRAAGLARRPHIRNRQKKEPTR